MLEANMCKSCASDGDFGRITASSLAGGSGEVLFFEAAHVMVLVARDDVGKGAHAYGRVAGGTKAGPGLRRKGAEEPESGLTNGSEFSEEIGEGAGIGT